MIHNDLRANHCAHNSAQAGKLSLLISSVVVMTRVVGVGSLSLLTSCQLAKAPINIKSFTTADNKRYYSLTTNCSAAKPSRHSLAIFMPKICLTNYQRFTNGINTNTSALQSRHKYSADSVGTNTYDGSSEPNKIPLWGNKLRRLNTVVNGLSPSFFAGDNKLTNCSGAIHHG